METTVYARPIDRYFAHYSDAHRNAANQRIHVIAVPGILWAVVALLWCIPVGASWFQSGVWAALGMFAAWMYYNRLSRPLGYGMLAVFFFYGCLCRLLEAHLGLQGLRWMALAVLMLASIAQCIGHTLEGRRPNFCTDAMALLIGPAWVLAKLYRHMRWRY
ncbi:DUF962 domain-containing protein [Xanthomonas albilineans]|uniref:Mpo1 family 2-hydroxy fatty acid dioxygenase n=1 Tax=Xanthomonas albilineans TaxID=29447 RepID=UPI0005F31B31|nr:Mpo1-like protein [Xanthomonas albilineans]PPU93970.1 DUF962 domain-containing protein [Xanthomonas albilineans]